MRRLLTFGHRTGRWRLPGAVRHCPGCIRADRAVFGPGCFPARPVGQGYGAGCRKLDRGDRLVDAGMGLSRDGLTFLSPWLPSDLSSGRCRFGNGKNEFCFQVPVRCSMAIVVN